MVNVLLLIDDLSNFDRLNQQNKFLAIHFVIYFVECVHLVCVVFLETVAFDFVISQCLV